MSEANTLDKLIDELIKQVEELDAKATKGDKMKKWAFKWYSGNYTFYGIRTPFFQIHWKCHYED